MDGLYRMDMARKFLQMGRTRSLRYALRPGGRKYESSSLEGGNKDEDKDKDAGGNHGKGKASGKGKGKGKEIPRTGKVYDEEKSRGARVFEDHLERVWADEVYLAWWEEWRGRQGLSGRGPRSLRGREVGKAGG